MSIQDDEQSTPISGDSRRRSELAAGFAPISRRRELAFSAVVLLLLILVPGRLSAQNRPPEDSRQVQQEEAQDYYRKWLQEDVVYIISADEEGVFKSLATDEEKEQFIEQFWIRRDPDLTTAANEYKEEHYRRIAYANEHFKSGIPGWKTDRGRIYILHGQPAEVESHKMGQAYSRPSNEGGGETMTYPFEIWRYRHIEGIGDNVELEFVDPGGSGEFRLAVTPWEKDALLMIPGAGLTLAEEMGVASRADHPYFKPYNADRYVGMHTLAKDDPFVRYETIARVQQPVPTKYQDLKQLIDVNVSYGLLPFETRADFFQLGPDQVLVSLSLELQNRDLSFKPEGDGQVARVAIYGLATSLSNRVVSEFEDDVVTSYPTASFSDGLKGRSVYQKVLALDRKSRYRLDLVLKDLNGEKIGHHRMGLIPPPLPAEGLSFSSLILADYLDKLERMPERDERFLIGDVKVRPNLKKAFRPRDPFWVYLQLYNAGLDQSTLAPSLKVTYRIFCNERRMLEIVDQSGETVQFFSGQRVVLTSQLPISNLKPGAYRVEVAVEDRISQQSTKTSEVFQIEG